MAKKGTYSAYQTQPPVQSGQFAGAGAFARMAQVNNQKRAEERAEQRQLKQEYKTALNNAVEAGNLDFGEINKSMHGIVGKVLNNYGDKMASMMEGINEDYSFERQMEIAQLKQDFQGKVGTLMGVSNAIETYSSGEWDNVMSVQSKNQLMSFIKDMPNINEKFDAETLSVGGQRIDQYFRKQVDPSGFVEEIDVETPLEGYAEDVFSTGNVEQSVERNGNIQNTYDVQNYSEREARGIYGRVFENTVEEKKLVRTILAAHEAIDDDNERAEFEARYMYVADDEAFVNSNGVYNYIKDNYLENKRRTRTKQEIIEPKESKTTGGVSPEVAKARLVDVDQFFNASGAVNLKEIKINVGGQVVDVDSGGRAYNWQTGEDETRMWYTKESGGSRHSGYRSYEPTVPGRQSLANQLFDGDLDYIRTAQEIGHTPTYEPLTFADRTESISKEFSRVADNILVAYSGAPMDVTEDGRVQISDNPHEYAMQGVKEQLREAEILSPAIETIIQKGVEKEDESLAFLTQDNFNEKVVFRDKALEAITLGAMASTSMKQDGLSPDEITKQTKKLVVDYYNSTGEGYDAFESMYSLDGVKRWARKNNMNEAEVTQTANNYLAAKARQGENVSDRDIIEYVTGSNKETESFKVKWAETNAPVAAGEEMDWEAAAQAKGYSSVQAAKIAYYNSKKQ